MFFLSVGATGGAIARRIFFFLLHGLDRISHGSLWRGGGLDLMHLFIVGDCTRQSRSEPSKELKPLWEEGGIRGGVAKDLFFPSLAGLNMGRAVEGGPWTFSG